MNCTVCEEEIFYENQNERWMMRVENSNWNDIVDGFDYKDVEINFCYHCGKDYREINREL